MSAIEVLRVARESGVNLLVVGTDLALDADQEPPATVVDDLRRHKASIINLLTAAEGNWIADDWQAFFDERAGIGEFDGGQTRAEATATAFECCIVEWLNQHPEPSDPDRCAWCGAEETSEARVVPCGTSPAGHTWLHPGCWDAWYQERHRKAASALMDVGITEWTA